MPLSQNFDGAKSDQPFLSRKVPRTGHKPSTTCPFSAIGFYSFWSPVSSAASTSVRHETTNSNHELTVPVKNILNCCPTDRVALYGLAEVAPKVNRNWNGGYRSQLGLGAKYEVVPDLQVEGLVSTFPLGISSGTGTTYNLGVRFVR